MARQERPLGNMESMDHTDTKQSKQRASIKWLLSKAFNNRVPENLQEPFYRDHEDQEHLKPPIVGGLANAELYCLALANMYSDPNYHSLNHWNILQTLARKGVHVQQPPDCALTETTLIQNNPLKMTAHMAVMEALMVLYAREVVTLDRVSAAAQRFGITQPPLAGSTIPHEDGLISWVNAACSALNRAEEDVSTHVPTVKSLQDLCDGTALAALISFYCPDALPRTSVRVGRMASIQDCLHNLMLVHDFCRSCLPHNVFHMLPEDVTYMRGSMKQNLIAMLADLFNMLEVHPVKCVKYPGIACAGAAAGNEHGVRHKRCLPPPPPAPIPDLRPDSDSASTHAPFTVPRSPSACAVRPRAPPGRSACSTPERRSCSPQRGADQFVVHRGKGVTTLASMARRDDDTMSSDSNPSAMTPAGRPSNWADTRDASFAGRRSRRSSITDDSQLTVENFGGSQDRLHFAGRNPEKELATVRKISAPAGPLQMQDTYNPPVRSSQQDIRGSIDFFQGDYQNGSSKDDRPAKKLDRQYSNAQNQNAQNAPTEPEPFYPIKRQLSSDAINLKNFSSFSNKGGGDGFYLNNNRDSTDGDGSKMSFADVNRHRSNGDQCIQHHINQFNQSEIESPMERRKSASFAPANTTTWQQQFMQQESHPNGDDLSSEELNSSGGQAMAAQLNNIRLKLEEKRRRIEQEKRRMELQVNKQRQQLGQQAFLQAVTRGKPRAGSERDEGGGGGGGEGDQLQDSVMDYQNQSQDNVALEQYQQSIAKLNSSLQDIQSDIARLASQQSQLQQQQQSQLQQQQQQQLQQQQSQLQQQLQLLQQQQQAAKQMFQQQPVPPQSPYQPYQNIPQLHSAFSSQHNITGRQQQAFGSTPHLSPLPPLAPPAPPREYRDVDEGARFFLHEEPQEAPQRRTWAQAARAQQGYQEPEIGGWQPQQQIYHQQQQHQQQQNHYSPRWRSPSPPPEREEPRWAPQHPQPSQGFMLHDRSQPFQVHHSDRNGGENNHLSYTVSSSRRSPPPLPAAPPPPPRPASRGAPPARRSDAVSLQQLSAPPDMDMEPQNISFIGNAEDDALRQGINKLNISSGTRTYRIPSPTRPSLNRNSFQQVEPETEKGFYISFDNEQPKRPKPPLRVKKMSPKKERSSPEFQTPERRSPDHSAEWNDRVQMQEPEFVVRRAALAPAPAPAQPAAIIIADNPDPNSAEEMERKKERIMLLSLQRRQRADEARARAEAAAAARRAREEAAREEKAARREEQARRRDLILHQYKLKKAIEEAEREGKVLDKTEYLDAIRAVGGDTRSAAPAPRLRPRPEPPRARPKTIHVDSGALQAATALQKQPSSTNLTGGTMRRDYYRGSQDSLAERAGLYRGSPVEERGAMSPSSNSSAPLGRRGSCKNSRERVDDPPPRGRPTSKYSTYQNKFSGGRKSSSLMNLCDSGLGRATPPRRAASPGARALGSPAAGSGPGSLPGGIGKRRVPQDDNSDASSQHSSIMDYSGPKLYKQPATKSNRGIMLNAVEYCVFPGAVNQDAKLRVLEEIARSEAKHFLVLFRDAGCQFRALYSFCPDTEAVTKLYGTGPKHVNDRMFDKFFKYNSGSKRFSQVHTKHLTVTIDAFTIHNALWQGKKVALPAKKDMALVI